MAGDSPYVRLTVDQLASLVDRLSVRNRSLDDKSRWTWQPIQSSGLPTINSQLVLPFNTFRRALIFSNPASVNIFIGNDQSVSGLNGVVLIASGQPLPLSYADFGAAVCREWWGIGAAGGARIAVLECVAPSQII